MDKNVEMFVNEFLASHGRQELSMDEAEQVVGGETITVIDGVRIITSVRQFESESDIDYYVYTFLASMEKALSKDVVIDYLKKDFPDYYTFHDYHVWGLDQLYNHLCQKFIDASGVH